MNLHAQLKERMAAGRPVRVGLIGAGKFGSMFLAQARLSDGLEVAGVADLNAERARAALERTGWPAASLVNVESSGELVDAARSRKVGVTTSAADLIDAEIDVVVECTGIPEAGTAHALRAIDRQCHVVMVTVESDEHIGPVS